MRSANFRSFVPIDAKPAEPVEDRLEGFFLIALCVGVVDAEDELPAGLFCK